MAVELIKTSNKSSRAQAAQKPGVLRASGNSGMGKRRALAAGKQNKTAPKPPAVSVSYATLIRRSPIWVEIVLLAAVCLIAARLVWLLFAPLPAPHAPPKLASVPVTSQVLVSGNPFKAVVASNADGSDGVGGAASSNEDGAPDVRETSLDLKLHGVWLSGDTSSATIQTPDKKQGVFRIGDTIWDSVTLDSVYANQVIINTNGFLEALKLPNKADFAGDTGLSIQPKARGGRSSQAVPSSDGDTPPKIVLGDIVRFRPARDSQGSAALALFPGANRAAFAEQGLVEGDLLISVDGVAVSGGASAIAALRQRFESGQSAFEIKVERGDALVDLTISVAR